MMRQILVVIIVAALFTPGALSGVALADDAPDVDAETNTTETPTPDDEEAPEPTDEEEADDDTDTPTDESEDDSDDSIVSAPTNVSVDFRGVVDGIVDTLSGGKEDSLDKGVIRYEEAEGEGYSTIYDWGPTRFVDAQFEPDSDTAVFVFYVTDDDGDTVAITESIDGSGEVRQTRAELDQGSGLYFVRVDIVHNDGLLGGEQCGSIATLRGSVNLHKECQETGIGPIIPDAPAPLQIIIGALAVATATLLIAKYAEKRRRKSVNHR